VIPTSQSFGTYVEKNSCRRLSFDRVLIPHSRSMSRFFDGGPKKCMVGSHHRFTASWKSLRCASVPDTISSTSSSPWRRCRDSSGQMRRIARTYGR
jgi:hypothetical protein